MEGLRSDSVVASLVPVAPAFLEAAGPQAENSNIEDDCHG